MTTPNPRDKIIDAALAEWEREAGEPPRAMRKDGLIAEIGSWQERAKLLIEIVRGDAANADNSKGSAA